MNAVSDDELASLNAGAAGREPGELLAAALDRFPTTLTVASSFGAEDVVLLDVLAKLGRRARIFTLDTGRLHPHTYDVQERVRAKYGFEIETYFPRHDAVEALVTTKGPFSFYESVDARRECCRIRKVEPLSRALAGVDGWVTGLRRSQAATRTDLQPFERDAAYGGILKVSPLAALSDDDVWRYIRAHKVPYNRLHDEGFPSIGCAPCTRPVKPGEDVRAGRWWWESPDSKECGLHEHNDPKNAGATRAF